MDTTIGKKAGDVSSFQGVNFADHEGNLTKEQKDAKFFST